MYKIEVINFSGGCWRYNLWKVIKNQWRYEGSNDFDYKTPEEAFTNALAHKKELDENTHNKQ